MFFHYGNCKSKIQELECRNVDLMRQVQELKAMYDYQVGILEKDVKAFEADVSYFKGQVGVLEEENAELKALSETNLKDNVRILAKSIRMAKEKDDLNTDIASLKFDIEEWKKQNAILKQELGARKCVADSCEQEIKDLKSANEKLNAEHKYVLKKLVNSRRKGPAEDEFIQF